MQIQFIANLLHSNNKVKIIIEKYLKDKNLLIDINDNIIKNITKLIEREILELIISGKNVFCKHNYNNMKYNLNDCINDIIINTTDYYFNNLNF